MLLAPSVIWGQITGIRKGQSGVGLVVNHSISAQRPTAVSDWPSIKGDHEGAVEVGDGEIIYANYSPSIALRKSRNAPFHRVQ